MSSHQLIISKASFTATLLRPDPNTSAPPLSKERIEEGFTLLNAVVLQCSPPNIQKCKRWILESITNSTARFTALGKYLTNLSNTFTEPPNSLHPTGKAKPSPRRKCLHILYLLNDVLHHAKVHSNDASIGSKVQPSLVALFSAAALFKNCPKHDRKIQDLLDLWAENGYYSTDYIAKLREAVRTSSESEQVSTLFLDSEQSNGEAGKSATRSPPFVMPAMHGDPSTPWYDLPAANFMPHIVPNSTRPIRPDLVKPLQFVAGPADEKLANTVKEFLVAVDEMYGGSREDAKEILWDVDELGQKLHLDEITGEVVRGEGYYGWSKEFCENMRRKRKGRSQSKYGNHSRSRSRSRSRSSSRSRSESGSEHPRSFKRRRRGSDTDSNSSRSRSRSRSRYRRYEPSRSNSRSLSRSRSPDGRFAGRSESQSEPQSRSNTIPPPPPQNSQPVYSRPMPFPTVPPSLPPPPSHFGGPPFAPNGMIPPPPPPPPPGYNGTWPPALPPQFAPQPSPYGQPNQNWPQAPQFNGQPNWQQNVAPSGPSGWNDGQQQYPGDGRGGYGWNGAPPRQYYTQQQQQQNQGYHGSNYRGGRGNFRGRGRG